VADGLVDGAAAAGGGSSRRNQAASATAADEVQLAALDMQVGLGSACVGVAGERLFCRPGRWCLACAMLAWYACAGVLLRGQCVEEAVLLRGRCTGMLP
jgi:hypothetical protein